MVHCLGERALFSSSFVAIFFFFFCDFFLQIHQYCYIIFAIDGSSFPKVIDEQNRLCIPKYRGQNLACWCLCLWLLWTAFTCCCPLGWLLIWLQNEVVDPCFIHGHIFTQKLLVVLKQLQTTLNRRHLFLIDCEQTQHSLWTKLSHRQIFMQNGEYIAIWYLQLHCYLTQLQFTISQNKFVEFFWCFSGQLPNLGNLSIQHHLCLYDHI